MKRALLLAAIAIASVYGVPANPNGRPVKQPDGSTIMVYSKGDESVHWLETRDGYPIAKDSSGYFEYLLADSGNGVRHSGVRVTDPKTRGAESDSIFLSTLKKGSPYSAETVKEKRTKYKRDGKSKKRGASRSGIFPSQGTRNYLVIPVQYPDMSFEFPVADFEEQFNGTGYSFREFYKEASYGKLTVTSKIAPLVTADNPHDYYGTDVDTDGLRAISLVRNAVIDALADDPSIDLADYDNDNDGVVDGIMVIHAGFGAEANDGMDIWSHAYELYDSSVTDGEITVSPYTIVPEKLSDGAYDGGVGISTVGVKCHEFGHNMGLPDLYDTDAEVNGTAPGCGSWELMDGGSWNGSPAGSVPAHMNALCKEQLGWMSVTKITGPNAALSIPPLSTTPTAYKYYTPTSGEYFMVESRSQIGFDAGLSGEGLLIYHVDSVYVDDHLASNTVNSDSLHQGVDLVENDSVYIDGYGNEVAFTQFTTGDVFDDQSYPASWSWAFDETDRPITVVSYNSETGAVLNVHGGTAIAKNGMALRAPLSLQVSNRTITLNRLPVAGATLTVTGLNGRVVMQQELSSQKMLANVAKGTYIWELKEPNLVTTGKMIVQ